MGRDAKGAAMGPEYAVATMSKTPTEALRIIAEAKPTEADRSASHPPLAVSQRFTSSRLPSLPAHVLPRVTPIQSLAIVGSPELGSRLAGRVDPGSTCYVALVHCRKPKVMGSRGKWS